MLILGGCGGASQRQLLVRAEVDLGCPSSRISTRTLVDSVGTGKTVAVEGCGRQATYVQTCEDSADAPGNCTWTR